MTMVISSVLQNADYFVLLLFRVGALVASSPIFGRNTIPGMVKIGFIGVLTYLFFWIGPAPAVIEYATLFEFFLLIAREIILGVALAFVTNLFFTMVYTSGQLIDMQIGFGIVNVYDSQNNTQIPMVGNVLNIVMLIVFFLVDGHQRLIYILFLTLEALPVGTLQIADGISYVALEIFANAFALGVMIALPVLASGLILEVCFGAMVRTVPQMNMFVVGIPIKTMVGFIMLSILIPIFVYFTDQIFSQMFSAIDLMFSTLSG